MSARERQRVKDSEIERDIQREKAKEREIDRFVFEVKVCCE